MDHSVNTQPLLEEDERDSDSDDTSSPSHSQHISGLPFPKGSEPRDWYKAYYITFYLMGIITLLPYTFFVTANDYWMYKLRDTTSNDTTFRNKTALQAEFTSYLTIAATGPSVFFMIINSIFSHRISLGWRMFGSLVIILLCFIATTAFVEINTDSWQELFFAITLSIVVLVNVSGAILQASLFAIACKFSSRYISALVSGQALGGMFPAIVYIASLALGASSTHSALLYFCIANAFIIITLISYYIFSQSLFFQFHMLVKAPVNTLQYDPMESDVPDSGPRIQVSVLHVFIKTWHYGFAAMMCYVVSLSVYPAVTVLVSSVSSHSMWTDKYFVPVVTFLVFSIWDYVGRVVAGFIKWPIKRKWIVFAMSLVRIGFVPLFLLCNAQPRHNLPVLINSDSAYIAISCFFGFTNGYLTNISLINIPKIVDGTEQEVASSLVAMFISIGCAFGALLSFVFLKVM